MLVRLTFAFTNICLGHFILLNLQKEGQRDFQLQVLDFY